MNAKRLLLKSLSVALWMGVATGSASALTLQLTNSSNVPVGTLASAEHLVRTNDSIVVTVIAENTPWDDNNWLGWTNPGVRQLNSIIRPPLGAGAVRSSTPPNPFGLTLLNDVNLGTGVFDSLYSTPDDAQLFSEDTLSRPSPNNTYQWFYIYDVSSLGFTNFRWHDGDGQVNSFSGDYDILIFADDDHTAPNFDYDDFMAGIGNARPATACDFTPAPTIAFGADFGVSQCSPAQICVPYSTTGSGTESLVSCPPGGTINTATNQVCFTPGGPGTYTLIAKILDGCGREDRDTIQVTVTLNSPPVLSFGSDFGVSQCTPTQICVPYTVTDPDGLAGHVESLVSGPAGATINIATNEVCFTPAASGSYQLIAKVMDPCSAEDRDTINVTVTLNSAPTIAFGTDFGVSQCTPTQICAPYTVSDPNGPLGLVETLVSGPSGTTIDSAANQVCFTPAASGTYTLIVKATDGCGALDKDTILVTVTLTPAPLATCPGNPSQTVCSLGEVQPVPGFSFANGAATVVGGTLNAGSVTITNPVAGDNLIKLIVTNACGADTCETVVNITVTPQPVATCPGNSSQNVCDLADVQPVPGFSFANGTATVIGGSLNAGSVTITNPVAGANLIKLIVTNACGADTCETIVNISVGAQPVATCPGNSSQTVCSLGEVQPVPGFAFANGTATVVGGTLNAGSVTITNPVAGANLIKLIVTNACGADTCETVVNITVGAQPVATCPGNSSQTVCDLNGVQPIPGFAYSNGTATVQGGTLSGGSVTLTNPAAGANLIRLIVANSCGADTCETVVNITVTGQPVATCPGNSSQTVCNLSQVQPIPGFSYSNGTPTVQGGTLNGGSVTLTNPVEGANLIKLIVTSDCGVDTCETVVNITLTDEPVASCPGNSAQTVCNLSQVQPIPGFSFSNGTATVQGGTLNAGSVTITNPVEGANLIKLIVTNACGADTCQTTVTIQVQDQPVCPDVPDTTAVRICDLYEYCLDLGTPSIGQNGFSCTVISGPGTVEGSQWCYTPQSLNDTVTVTVECNDNCQNLCQTTFTVAFFTDNSCAECPTICIDTLTAAPGSTASVCIKVHEGGLPWGGFDFLLQYDPSLLTFQGVDPGQFLIDCDWEYFTYRVLGGTATSGLVRIVAIADMNNSNDHPLCQTPGPGDIIACLTFRVTSDWTLSCRDALIQWHWIDCSDNSISDPSGDILYIASGAPGSIVNWEGVDLTGSGALGGPPFPCPSDKGEPQECTHFCGGKIKIICPGDIDDRGDLNLNAVSYEIADAVLYSRYFISGPSVFAVNALGQIAASDVNADGTALTVADLVYLIRVITGDEQPITNDLLGGGPKVAGTVGSIQITTETRDGRLTVASQSNFDLGAALLVFNTNGAAVRSVQAGPRALSMDVSYQVTGDQLRVLLYNIEDKARIAAGSGDVLDITFSGNTSLELVEAEAATFAGGTLSTELVARVLPAQFALHANHPNPFNPSTSFNVDFPTATDYTVVIYNIAGQAVRTYAGSAQAGTTTIHWDGRSESGVSVASGVYFYQISAGPYHDVRKMVLMK